MSDSHCARREPGADVQVLTRALVDNLADLFGFCDDREAVELRTVFASFRSALPDAEVPEEILRDAGDCYGEWMAADLDLIELGERLERATPGWVPRGGDDADPTGDQEGSKDSRQSEGDSPEDLHDRQRRPEATVSPPGVHSAKPTRLSKDPELGTSLRARRLQGGHAEAGDSSILKNGRDDLAEPVRELIKVLRAVAMGPPRPVAIRSGILVPETGAPAMASNDFPDKLALADDPSAGKIGPKFGRREPRAAQRCGLLERNESSSRSSLRSPSIRSSSKEVRSQEEPAAPPQEKPGAWRHVMRRTVHRAAGATFATACG